MRRGKKSLAKDLGIGLALTLGLLAAGELALRLAGIGEPAHHTSLSRGFDVRAAYLVPDPDVERGWRSQFSDGKFPEIVVPPKRADRTRVVLFGGSNTTSLRANWLEHRLDQLAEPGAFEVVNLGRSGYGSERVAILLEQALERVAPDVVVVYSGHNEFIERGFRMDLDERWSSPSMAVLGDWATHLRTVSWLAGLFEPPPATKRPEAWDAEYRKFRGLPYSETQRYFEAYERNLERMCRAALAAGARVVLCTVVYNRFAPPHECSCTEGLEREAAARFEALHEEARALLPEYARTIAVTEAPKHVYKFDWLAPQGGPARSDVDDDLPGRRACYGPLAEADPMLLGPSPKVRRLYEALERLHARDPEPAERERLERAAAGLERALEICPDHPLALFELALVSYLLGQERSVELFEAAARYDRAPRKASAATNEIVRRVAREIPEVELFDADRIFAHRMPMGLVGWEWMVDGCHLSAGAGRVLLDDLASAIVSAGG